MAGRRPPPVLACIFDINTIINSQRTGLKPGARDLLGALLNAWGRSGDKVALFLLIHGPFAHAIPQDVNDLLLRTFPEKFHLDTMSQAVYNSQEPTLYEDVLRKLNEEEFAGKGRPSLQAFSCLVFETNTARVVAVRRAGMRVVWVAPQSSWAAAKDDVEGFGVYRRRYAMEYAGGNGEWKQKALTVEDLVRFQDRFEFNYEL